MFVNLLHHGLVVSVARDSACGRDVNPLGQNVCHCEPDFICSSLTRTAAHEKTNFSASGTLLRCVAGSNIMLMLRWSENKFVGQNHTSHMD